MEWIRIKLKSCFSARERPYITPRRANRRFINILKGHRNVNRFKKRKITA